MKLIRTKLKDNDKIADIVTDAHTFGQDNVEQKEQFTY